MKPHLLLHICCAPDEAWVVHTLSVEYDLRCYFCNPNIQPQSEYEKRLAEAAGTAAHYNIPFDSEPYRPQQWENSAKEYTGTPEGGARCEQCFLLRLRQTAAFCKSIGWERFTTVMSISPHKRIDMLNKTGAIAANELGLIYEPFNFKKNNGFLNSIKLSKELGLYRQDYCGCRLSKAERDARNHAKSIAGRDK
jgi:epoxyqueuosine reductase